MLKFDSKLVMLRLQFQFRSKRRLPTVATVRGHFFQKRVLDLRFFTTVVRIVEVRDLQA